MGGGEGESAAVEGGDRLFERKVSRGKGEGRRRRNTLRRT